jgi:hypothetical protein
MWYFENADFHGIKVLKVKLMYTKNKQTNKACCSAELNILLIPIDVQYSILATELLCAL